MNANYEDVAATNKPPMLPDVVESLGVGLAQIIVLISGPFGILMSEGILFSTLTSITTSVTTDLEVGEHDHGLLSTLAFVGLFIGVSSSGLIADVFGRRPIVLMGYGILIVGLLLCALLKDWTSISFAGLLAGAGVGLGTPPSIALLSEMTPSKWKIGMRGATGTGYCLGVVAVCMIAAQDDVNMQQLNWRILLIKSAVPIVALLILAVVLLPESPVFLASIGYRAEAEHSFRQLARRNGKHITGAYELPAAENTEMLSCSKQMRVVFSPERWFVTLAATYGCFCMNFTQYGRAYAAPIIFADTSSVPAAYEIAMGAIPGAVMNIMAAGVGDYFDRRTSIVAASIICWTAAWALIISGDLAKPRSFIWEAVFQYGSLFGGVGTALGFCVLFQVAVEIYPASSAATGAAFVIGVARVGAIIAPDMFEFLRSWLGEWQSFFELSSTFQVVCTLLWLCMRSSLPKGTDDPGEEMEKAKLIEKTNLMDKNKLMEYSTLPLPAKEV